MPRRFHPDYEKWRRRVAGQVRDCISHHPRWFVFKDERDKNSCIHSLTKRIVGEIVLGNSLLTENSPAPGVKLRSTNALARVVKWMRIRLLNVHFGRGGVN